MKQQKATLRRTRRRGVASFEFVMSFPILAFIFAMIYTGYVAIVTQSQVAMETRHKAWLVRSTPPEASPFNIQAADRAGEELEELERSIGPYRNWYPGVRRKAEWGNVLLVGSWDHRAVEFKPKGWIPIYPHFGVLRKIAFGATGIGGVSSGDANQAQQLTSFPTN